MNPVVTGIRSAAHRWVLPVAVLALAALQLVRIRAQLFPTLDTINVFDEVQFVDSGRRLAAGELPDLAGYPLLSVLYLVPYLLTWQAELWVLPAAALGHLAIWVLLWAAVLLLGRELARRDRLGVPGLLPALLFGAAPSAGLLMQNSSDGLFVALSVLSFARLSAWERTQGARPLMGASFLLGLAALARNDGVLLLGVVTALAAHLGRRRGGALRAAALSALPAAGVLLSWFGLQAAVTGRIELGSRERLYLAFEQGQGVAYDSIWGSGDAYVLGMAEARRLYGTPQENRISVTRAIRRNPAAFLDRLRTSLATLPAKTLIAYGAGCGVLMALLAVAGVVELARKRELGLLAISVVWPVNLSIHLLTFFRHGQLLLAYAAPLALASVGAAALRSRASGFRPLAPALIACALLAGTGAALGSSELVRAGVVLTAALALLAALPRLCATWPREPLRAALLIAAALAAAGPGPSRQAQADPSAWLAGVRVLREQLSPGARVAAAAPLPVALAQREHVPTFLALEGATRQEELLAWLAEHEVSAVFVDARLERVAPDLVRLLETSAGEALELLYRSPDAAVQVLVVRSRP